ncbi:hypothetical protein E3N88_26611 [Mikania micrantha]|uniref:Protein BIG GRAIN 1-like B n=1 Tax=Mikania micrantha TaxID=192012 RepID=A0A5N6MVE6_9ASTR|nr:hypothetical protein E3N88_26611 [Mikania micrantha]
MAEMYNWDNSLKHEKSNKNKQNPSFSSCLLDEIYRSIDGGDEKFGEFKLRKQKVSKKQTVKTGGTGGSGGGSRGRSRSKSAVEDEEIAGFRRGCLVDKWMEMKGNKKAVAGPPTLPEFDQKFVFDNDPMFFSSGSSSSDSSFGWYSEAEAVKPKPSCFGPLNRVKTSVPSRSGDKKDNGFYPFDNDQTDKTDINGLISSKTRALKIYTSLKKMKQPISPGGRLTTFINAIFTNGHFKKSKDLSCEDKTQTRVERKSKSINVSTCSSTSSFSRSCLNKNASRSVDHLNNGGRRTVRFVDHEDSDQKIIFNDQDFGKLPPTTFPWPRTEKLNFNEVLMKYDDKKINLDDDEEDEEDMASDSSSDLFELDHLAMINDDQYCEGLPVYETTHMSTNRAIASGLVC